MIAYAHIKDVKAGDVLVADAGFTCLQAGEVLVVQDDGGLFVPCSTGRHYLDGQLDEGEVYIGLTKREGVGG